MGGGRKGKEGLPLVTVGAVPQELAVADLVVRGEALGLPFPVHCPDVVHLHVPVPWLGILQVASAVRSTGMNVNVSRNQPRIAINGTRSSLPNAQKGWVRSSLKRSRGADSSRRRESSLDDPVLVGLRRQELEMSLEMAIVHIRGVRHSTRRVFDLRHLPSAVRGRQHRLRLTNVLQHVQHLNLDGSARTKHTRGYKTTGCVYNRHVHGPAETGLARANCVLDELQVHVV